MLRYLTVVMALTITTFFVNIANAAEGSNFKITIINFDK